MSNLSKVFINIKILNYCEKVSIEWKKVILIKKQWIDDAYKQNIISKWEKLLFNTDIWKQILNYSVNYYQDKDFKLQYHFDEVNFNDKTSTNEIKNFINKLNNKIKEFEKIQNEYDKKLIEAWKEINGDDLLAEIRLAQADFKYKLEKIINELNEDYVKTLLKLKPVPDFIKNKGKIQSPIQFWWEPAILDFRYYDWSQESIKKIIWEGLKNQIERWVKKAIENPKDFVIWVSSVILAWIITWATWWTSPVYSGIIFHTTDTIIKWLVYWVDEWLTSTFDWKWFTDWYSKWFWKWAWFLDENWNIHSWQEITTKHWFWMLGWIVAFGVIWKVWPSIEKMLWATIDPVTKATKQWIFWPETPLNTFAIKSLAFWWEVFSFMWYSIPAWATETLAITWSIDQTIQSLQDSLKPEWLSESLVSNATFIGALKMSNAAWRKLWWTRVMIADMEAKVQMLDKEILRLKNKEWIEINIQKNWEIQITWKWDQKIQLDNLKLNKFLQINQEITQIKKWIIEKKIKSLEKLKDPNSSESKYLNLLKKYFLPENNPIEILNKRIQKLEKDKNTKPEALEELRKLRDELKELEAEFWKETDEKKVDEPNTKEEDKINTTKENKTEQEKQDNKDPINLYNSDLKVDEINIKEQIENFYKENKNEVNQNVEDILKLNINERLSKINDLYTSNEWNKIKAITIADIIFKNYNENEWKKASNLDNINFYREKHNIINETVEKINDIRSKERDLQYILMQILYSENPALYLASIEKLTYELSREKAQEYLNEKLNKIKLNKTSEELIALWILSDKIKKFLIPAMLDTHWTDINSLINIITNWWIDTPHNRKMNWETIKNTKWDDFKLAWSLSVFSYFWWFFELKDIFLSIDSKFIEEQPLNKSFYTSEDYILKFEKEWLRQSFDEKLKDVMNRETMKDYLSYKIAEYMLYKAQENGVQTKDIGNVDIHSNLLNYFKENNNIQNLPWNKLWWRPEWHLKFKIPLDKIKIIIPKISIKELLKNSEKIIKKEEGKIENCNNNITNIEKESKPDLNKLKEEKGKIEKSEQKIKNNKDLIKIYKEINQEITLKDLIIIQINQAQKSWIINYNKDTLEKLINNITEYDKEWNSDYKIKTNFEIITGIELSKQWKIDEYWKITTLTFENTTALYYKNTTWDTFIEDLKQYLIKKYNIDEKKISIFDNYIEINIDDQNIDLFKTSHKFIEEPKDTWQSNKKEIPTEIKKYWNIFKWKTKIIWENFEQIKNWFKQNENIDNLLEKFNLKLNEEQKQILINILNL